MVIRVTENIGTAGPNAFTAFGGNVYFGLGGNDRFGIFPWQDGLLTIGGRGSDAYFAANNSVMTVMDVGSSDGDSLLAPGFGFQRASSYAAIVDGSHLLLGDSQSGSNVIIIDWLSNANRIETIQTADGALSSAAVAQLLAGRPVPQVGWEGLGAFGLKPLNTAEMNEAIAFYTNRALELEGITPPTGGNPPPNPPGNTPGTPAGNPLFDSAFYLASYPDVAAAGIDPLQHYRDFGWKEGRNPDDCFDTSDYLQNNPDVAAAGINPLDHFYLFGGKEGRDPSPDFDSSRYLAENPDVAASGMNPLFHFLHFGDAEGREAFDIFGNVSPCDPTPPQVLTLDFTLNDDNLTGTAGDDTGRALLLSSGGGVRASIGSKDIADFGGGNDSLDASLNGDGEDGNGAGPRPTLTGLEEIRFTPVKGGQGNATFFDASGVSGLQRLVVSNGANGLTVGNVAGALTGGLTVVDPVTPAAVTVTFAAGVLAGGSDALGVTLDSSTGLFDEFGVVTVKSAAGGESLETVNLVSTGQAATNVLENIIGGGLSLNVNLAAAGLTINSDTTHAAVRVSGSHDFTALGELLGATFIDASSLSGRFTANADDTLAVHATTGSGNDTIDFSDDQPGYTMSDQWNGGAGTDRIIVRSGDLSDGSFSLITQTQSNLSNIEQLAVQDVFVGTVDLQHFAAVGIDQYFFAGSSGGAALNFGGLSNTLTFTADALGDLTLDHVGLGVSDSIAFVLNNADVNGVLTINDFETINIVSIGGANTITGALSPFATGGGFAPVTVTGTTALTLAGTSEAQVLNAGAFTANLTMSDFFGTDLTAVPGPTGATITGGSGNDRLVGEIDPARPDTVGGGIGNDLIYGTPINFDGASNTSGDVLTGGAGSDVFVFEGEDEGSTLRISSGTTRLTHITDFAAGIDKIAIVNDFANYTSFVLDGTQTIGTAANLAAVYAAIAAIPASAGGGALHGAFIVVSGGGAAGSYLYVNDAFGGVSNTDDMLLSLTGISGTFSAGDVSLIGPPVV